MKAENGLYKIGRSKMPKERLKDLERQFPIRIWLEHTIASDDYIMAELDLHKAFAGRLKGNEWFALNDNDVETIKGM